MIQLGVTACASLAWMNTCSDTPRSRTGTSPLSGLDVHPRPQRPLPTSRHGPRLLQQDLQNLAGCPARYVARPHQDRDSPGFKSAAAEELTDARAVMDPFHVVHLARDALDERRRRIQQELRHRCRRATDPSTRPAGCYTPDPACSPHASSTRSSTCSPAIVTSPSKSSGASTRTSSGAYHAPDTSVGKALMQAEIACLSDAGVPSSLTEIVTLGRTLKRRAGDVLAYFDHPYTSNGPTEAINGRLEHLRGSAPGLPKPHQLQHPSTPRNRRIQTPTTPPIMKSHRRLLRQVEPAS